MRTGTGDSGRSGNRDLPCESLPFRNYEGYFRMLETRPADWSANPSFASLRDYFTNSQ